eukprot:937195_1
MIQTPVLSYSSWFIVINVLLIQIYGETTVFQHKFSKSMSEIEAFINEMSPSSVTRIFGGISYPNLHVWVANDNSGKQYDFKLTGWSLSEFVGSNTDIDIEVNNVMAIGFKPTPSPYFYWVQQHGAYIETKAQTTLFKHKSSRSIDEIEAFINTMSPSSVTRIFGGVSYPNLHVWVANDNSGRNYSLHLTTWKAFPGHPGDDTDIDVSVNDVMIFDFRPSSISSDYCYWIEDITKPTTMVDSTEYIDGNFSCNNLHENVGLEYDKAISECITFCDNTDGCEMFNYFEDFKQINDSRCYIFDTSCDINIDNERRSAIGYFGLDISCIDYPFDWKDNTGDSCDYYETYNWCANTTFLRTENEFYDLMDYTYQLTAIDSCCECGGAVRIMDDVAFSIDNWIYFEDILCTWEHSSFTPQSSLRNWNNLILYELCHELED